MERKVLQPEQIIVPGEYELGNESILKIYFRIMDSGHNGDLPPAIVTSPSHFNYFQLLDEGLQKDITSHRNWPIGRPWITDGDVRRAIRWSQERVQEKKEGYSDLIQKIDQYVIKHNNIYLLIDGNHKSAAATLTHNPILALELQTDDDIAEERMMVKKGDLFDFKRSENSLSELVNSYYGFCKDKLEKVNTLRERIDALTSNGDLPQYMKERYLRGNIGPN